MNVLIVLVGLFLSLVEFAIKAAIVAAVGTWLIHRWNFRK
jgi:hypothetical protein